MDPATQAAMTAAAGQATGMGPAEILHLLWEGRLTVIPLGILSVVALAILIQQLLRLRGLDRRSRELTRKVIDAIVKHDLLTARSLCESSKTPLSGIFIEGLRWRNIALEDLNAVLSTARAEAVTELKRGLWVLGTIGSLAPFIGLFGTVWGILRSFHDMAIQGSGGFAVVASGISEALAATAAGLLVAIIALAFYNWLQVRNGAVAGVFSRSCERLVQALLYVESGTGQALEDEKPAEVRHGRPLPA